MKRKFSYFDRSWKRFMVTVIIIVSATVMAILIG